MYNLHIIRKEDWLDKDGPTIPKEEWESVIDDDMSLFKDSDEKVWFISPEGDKNFFWFDSTKGEIVVGSPSQEAADKAVEIAKVLHARVQGDDGEFYE